METNKRKRFLEWGQNLAILLLALSAILLISQSALYDGFGIFSTSQKEQQGLTEHPQPQGKSSMSVEPVSLVVQNPQGRYGVQYDSKTTHQLFEDKLGSLLREALSGVKEVIPANREQWQDVLQGTGSWIYYDFSTSLPLDTLPLWLGGEPSDAALKGVASTFLLTNVDQTYRLYYYDKVTQTYGICTLAEGSGERFLASISDIPQNGALFAFEDSKRFGALNENVMILPQIPIMPVYEVKNPIAMPDKATLEAIMRDLSFNPSAAKVFEPADGTAIKEGTAATLRIFNNGTISFHGQESDPRFPVSQENVGAMIERAQELLLTLMANRCGDARPYLASIETKENGATLLSFEYHLNGAPVKIYSEGYAAQFTIQNGFILDFTVHLRQYLPTEENSLILPERQAAANVKAMGKTGHNLHLAYLDTGEELHIAANWILE